MTHKLFDARLTIVGDSTRPRNRPISSGYRGLLRFNGAGEFFGVEMTTPGDLWPDDTETVSARIWAGDLLPSLSAGDAVELFEGPHLLGRGVLLTSPTSDIARR